MFKFKKRVKDKEPKNFYIEPTKVHRGMVYVKNPISQDTESLTENVCPVKEENLKAHLDKLENLFADTIKTDDAFYGLFGKKGKITYNLLSQLERSLWYETHPFNFDWYYKNIFDSYSDIVPRRERKELCDQVVCKEIVDDFNEKMKVLITKVKNRLNSDDARLAVLIKMTSFSTEAPTSVWEQYRKEQEISSFQDTNFYLIYTEGGDGLYGQKTQFSSSLRSYDVRVPLLDIPWRYKDTNFHVVPEKYLNDIFGAHHILGISSLETHWDEELFENVHGIYQDGSGGLTLSEAVEVAKHI